MDTAYCPATREASSGATWRCNLLPGHVGPHDDGIDAQWHDNTTTGGPDRLKVAAVNILGSRAAWDALRPALEKAVGADLTTDATRAVHDVLCDWAKGRR